MTIAVIGSINIDLFYHTDNHPLMGQTVTGQSYFIRHGGKGANQAVMLKRLYDKVCFLGAVGNDAFSTLALENLKTNALKETDIVIKNTQSGFALIALQNNDNAITIFDGANGALNKNDVDRFLNHHHDIDYIVLQLEIPMDVVAYIVEKANRQSIKVILNPAPAKPLSKKILDKCTYIIPNETEFETLYGSSTPKEDMIIQHKGRLVVTLGDKGVLYYGDNQVKHAKAHDIEGVDTTGAGDSFIAGFVAMIGKSASMDEAVENGQKIAAKTCLCEGAQCFKNAA